VKESLYDNAQTSRKPPAVFGTLGTVEIRLETDHIQGSETVGFRWKGQSSK
jgi:hypothetical protein